MAIVFTVCSGYDVTLYGECSTALYHEKRIRFSSHGIRTPPGPNRNHNTKVISTKQPIGVRSYLYEQGCPLPPCHFHLADIPWPKTTRNSKNFHFMTLWIPPSVSIIIPNFDVKEFHVLIWNLLYQVGFRKCQKTRNLIVFIPCWSWRHLQQGPHATVDATALSRSSPLAMLLRTSHNKRRSERLHWGLQSVGNGIKVFMPYLVLVGRSPMSNGWDD